jgi:hypothetical protein
MFLFAVYYQCNRLFSAVLLRHQRYGTLRRKCRDRMLINHLLAAFAIDDNGKIIERTDDPADLKPIRQIDGNGNVFFSKLIQKSVLDIDRFVHHGPPQ